MAESGRKAVIKNADMAEDMQQDAVEVATAVRAATRDDGMSQSGTRLWRNLRIPVYPKEQYCVV